MKTITKTGTTHLFTPDVRKGSQERAYMQLNETDYAKVSNKAGAAAIVTDQNTNRMFLVEWNAGYYYYSPTCPVSNYYILEEVRISTGKANNVPLFTPAVAKAAKASK